MVEFYCDLETIEINLFDVMRSVRVLTQIMGFGNMEHLNKEIFCTFKQHEK